MQRRTLAAVSLCALLGASDAAADQWNKRTRLDLDETVQVPGATLKPGKYVVKLADSPANRHIVRFFNEDESQVIATVLAIPNQKMRPSGETQLGWYETPAGEPPALRSWFYPGDTFGQQFVYPKEQARAIAGKTRRNVPAMDDDAAKRLNSRATRDDAPPVWDEKARIYSWGPDNRETTLDEGFSADERTDRDPAYRDRQKNYERYGRFGNGSEGTRAREKR
ncbi:MAG TPA: hypothetical protein VES20_10020 [Bryobacteraceae bacterium]|nr:hypothetical protein [Bryobacteraceae bacterium]